jgi:CheY-like chemotaxis protein
MGYEVSSEASSILALEIFREKPDSFDVVIADWDMPEMNGDTLLAEIRKIRPDIPTIMISGYFEEVSDEKAVDLNVSALVIKPIKPQVLDETIKKVLNEGKGSG